MLKKLIRVFFIKIILHYIDFEYIRWHTWRGVSDRLGLLGKAFLNDNREKGLRRWWARQPGLTDAPPQSSHHSGDGERWGERVKRKDFWPEEKIGRKDWKKRLEKKIGKKDCLSEEKIAGRPLFPPPGGGGVALLSMKKRPAPCASSSWGLCQLREATARMHMGTMLYTMLQIIQCVVHATMSREAPGKIRIRSLDWGLLGYPFCRRLSKISLSGGPES